MSGRPTLYSNELADRMCDVIAQEGRGIGYLCDKYDFFPAKNSVFKWLREQEYFRNKYADAKFLQCVPIFEDLLDISDDSSQDYFEDAKGFMRVDHEHINRSKLRVETRKWKLSVLQPKKYGKQLEDGSTDEALSKLNKVKVEKCSLKEI
jgi:hypothetical protein